MPDIFISYSSKDRAQAVQLIALLASAGLSVWIPTTRIIWRGSCSMRERPSSPIPRTCQLEDMYGLRHADSAGMATPITDVWGG